MHYTHTYTHTLKSPQTTDLNKNMSFPTGNALRTHTHTHTLTDMRVTFS